MKTYSFKLLNFTYTIDFPVFLMFFGDFLDILSTFNFVLLNTGTEANFILKDLIPLSVWFILFYRLFATNSVFVPFLSDVLRKTFGYTFGLMSILFGLNNLSAFIFGYAFLLENLSYNAVVIVYFLLGIPLLIYLLKRKKLNKKQTIFTGLKFFIFILCIALSNFIFVLISWIKFL